MKKGRRRREGPAIESDATPFDEGVYDDSVRKLAEQLGEVETNYVGVRQGGPGTYDDAKMHARERGEDSELHILELVSRICFSPSKNVEMTPLAKELRRTEGFSAEDRAGTDIATIFTDEFAQFTGFAEVGIQCKSSETGVDVFAATGERKFGEKGDAWIEAGRILLDGQWVDNAIIADFLIQLMNLMGIWGSEDEVADFLSCLDQVTVTAYNRAYLQIEQFRGGLLAWVAGRPQTVNGGSTKIY